MAEEQKTATSPSPSASQTQAGPFFAMSNNIYFNGFALGLTNADVNAILLLDGQPVGRINMSFTTAKTLVVLLNELINKLESVTGRDIMTTRQVEEGLKTLLTTEE